MFTDAADGTRPVGRDRRGFLKELGLGGIARERRLSCRRLGAATFLSPTGSGDFLVAGWERRLSCRRPPWEKGTITSSLPYILAIPSLA